MSIVRAHARTRVLQVIDQASFPVVVDKVVDESKARIPETLMPGRLFGIATEKYVVAL